MKHEIMSNNETVVYIARLRDLASNVAGLSDEWLDHNAIRSDRLLQLINEYRRQAREALESHA